MAKKKQKEIEISVAEVVDYLRITGQFGSALCEVVGRKVTADAARRAGIKVTARDLQKTADVFRQMLGLNKAAATRKWLANQGLTLENLEDYLETNLLINKFKERLAKKAPKNKSQQIPVVQEIVAETVYQEWLAKELK